MDYQLLAAVLISIALLLLLILRFKIQAFLALLIASMFAGILAGMPPTTIIDSMKKGMGDTLGFVATVVGLGALFGALLERSRRCPLPGGLYAAKNEFGKGTMGNGWNRTYRFYSCVF